MKAKLTLAVLVLALAALTAAGCGDDEQSGSTGPANTQAQTTDTATTETDTTGTEESGGAGGGGEAQKLAIAADPDGALKFDKSELEAKAGPVEIVMENPSTLPHAVEIEGQGEAGEVVNEGGTSTAKADLQPGTYTYYCPVPGHEQGGMKGTLTVK